MAEGRRSPSVRWSAMGVVLALNLTMTPSGSVAQQVRRPAWVTREAPRLAWLTTPSIAVSPSGARVYVIASVRGEARVPKLLIRARWAASGVRMWSVRYRGREQLTHQAGWATVDASGAVYVLAEFRRASGERGAVAISFDGDDGTRRWVSDVHGPGGVQAGGLTLSPDGTRLYVGVTSAPAPEHVAVTSLDTANGAVVWTGRYEGPDDRPDLMDDQEGSIVASDDAVIVAVTGRHARRQTSRGWATTVAFDAATGDVRWDGVSGRAGYAAQYSEHALAFTPDQQTLITGGWSRDLPAAVAFDVATGTRVWHRTFERRPDGSLQSAAVSPDGEQVLLAGNAGPDRLVVVALAAASGSVAWWNEKRDWKGYPWVLDAALAPNGSSLFVPVILCGPEADVEIFGCYLNYGLFRYRSMTGRRSLVGRLRATRFGRHEIPSDVAQSPDGQHSFVTGYTAVRASPRWYATTAGFDLSSGRAPRR